MLLTIPNAFFRTWRSHLLSICLSACTLPAAAQYVPPPPPLTTALCVPTKKEPCLPSSTVTPAPIAEKFPFPSEPGAAAPSSTPPSGSAAPSANTFPFPGDPESAAKPPTAAPAKSFPFPSEPESGASSSSSSSSSSDSSSDDTAVDSAPPPANARPTRAQRRLLPKVEDVDKRESEDLDISKYYASTGNFLGSYMRAQDAVKTVPDDPMAHFALAQSAGKLNKKDEAIAEYKLYLQLDPEGEKVKESQRALAALTAAK